MVRYVGIIPIMENQMRKKMDNEMETGVFKGLYRHPSLPKRPTMVPRVCKYDLHGAIWILKDRAEAGFVRMLGLRIQGLG